ncbi:hypothetical protein HPULCUR_000843 [Helicostylum pulchrum]|uniref:Uncharacterized protein n=1 Tax=Helicostylum pulchrum TaxID=562976 RepID=A0ABP9XMQ2_9FUNG
MSMSPIFEKPEVTVAPPTASTEKSTSQQKFSASQELQISEQDSDDDDDEDDIGVPHEQPTLEDQLHVTRYINLDDKHYMDEEETDEEEAELNSKLQHLIDDQVNILRKNVVTVMKLIFVLDFEASGEVHN